MTKQIQTVDKIKKDYFDQWDATEHPSTCDSLQYGVEHCNCFIEAKWKWVEETIAQTQQEAVERERELTKRLIADNGGELRVKNGAYETDVSNLELVRTSGIGFNWVYKVRKSLQKEEK